MIGLDTRIEHGDGLACAGGVQCVGRRHADQRHAVDQRLAQHTVIIDANDARIIGQRLQFLQSHIDRKSRRDRKASDPAVEALAWRRIGGVAEMRGDDAILGRGDPSLGIGNAGCIRLELPQGNGRVEHHDHTHVPVLLRSGGDLRSLCRLLRQGAGLRQDTERQRHHEQHSKCYSRQIAKTACCHDVPPMHQIFSSTHLSDRGPLRT